MFFQCLATLIPLLNLIIKLNAVCECWFYNFSSPLAPSTIIYDNSCNLAAYALRRDPGFFKNSRFLIDRFHYRNHTGEYDIPVASYEHTDIQILIVLVAAECIFSDSFVISFSLVFLLSIIFLLLFECAMLSNWIKRDKLACCCNI